MHRIQPTGLLVLLWMGILPLLGQTYTPVASILEWNKSRNQPALYLQWVEAIGVVLAHPAIEEKLEPSNISCMTVPGHSAYSTPVVHTSQ